MYFSQTKKSRIFVLLFFALLLSGCGTLPPPQPPRVDGSEKVAINDDDTSRAMVMQQRLSKTDENLRRCTIEKASLESALTKLQAEPTKPVVIEKFKECPAVKIVTRDTGYVGNDNLVVSHTVHFDRGSANFVATDEIRQDIDLMRQATRIDVLGRTDSAQDTPADRRLSVGRALSAREWMVENGVPQNVIFINALSHGDFLDWLEDRNQSRRVEILIYGEILTDQ